MRPPKPMMAWFMPLMFWGSEVVEEIVGVATTLEVDDGVYELEDDHVDDGDHDDDDDQDDEELQLLLLDQVELDEGGVQVDVGVQVVESGVQVVESGVQVEESGVQVEVGVQVVLSGVQVEVGVHAGVLEDVVSPPPEPSLYHQVP